MNQIKRAILKNIDDQRCAYLIATRNSSPITISVEDALAGCESWACNECGTVRDYFSDGGLTKRPDGIIYGKCVECDDEWATFSPLTTNPPATQTEAMENFKI